MNNASEGPVVIMQVRQNDPRRNATSHVSLVTVKQNNDFPMLRLHSRNKVASHDLHSVGTKLNINLQIETFQRNI